MYIKEEGFEAIQAVLDVVKKQYETKIESYEQKLATAYMKPQKLGVFPEKREYVVSHSGANLNQSSEAFFVRTTGWSGKKDVTFLDALEAEWNEIQNKADQYIADCKAVQEANIPLIENNKKVISQIMAIMDAFGIPHTYSHTYYKSSRSNKATKETKRAGYLEDIDRNIQVYNPPLPNKDDILRYIKVRYEKLKSSILEKQKEEEKKKQEAEKIHSLALLRAKYTPEDALSSAEDILDVILSKNKYLRLAHFLQLNRGDWSDGCSYAEAGIDGFSVETDEDQEIYEDIMDYIDSWGDHGDGRVFRDCKWNYNEIFSLVDDDALRADYNKVYSMCERWQ